MEFHSLYAADHQGTKNGTCCLCNRVCHPSANTKAVIAALNPVVEITKSATSASDYTNSSKDFGNHEDDHGIHTMKGEMLNCLNRCYAAVEGNAPLVLASLLDPRFKDKFSVVPLSAVVTPVDQKSLH